MSEKITSAEDLENTKVAYEEWSDSELREKRRLFYLMKNEHLVDVGSKLAEWALKLKLPFVKSIIENTFYKMFCGGVNLDQCNTTIEQLARSQSYTILDYGAEGGEDVAIFEQTFKELLKSIKYAADNTWVPVVTLKMTGIGSFSLYEKIQAGKPLNEQEEMAFGDVRRRLIDLCKQGQASGVAIMIDAEESWIQNVIDELCTLMMEEYNKEKVIVYNTYQMYRKGKFQELKAAHQLAQEKGYLLGAKVVRGAYMNKEADRAAEMGYPNPIHDSKQDTDEDFNAAIAYCIKNMREIAHCNATHNIDSCVRAAKLIEVQNVANNDPHLNFCQLYGMGDFITFNLSDKGYNVAKYVPYGPVEYVMPYLIRRARENSSVTGEVGRELSMINREVKRRTEEA